MTVELTGAIVKECGITAGADVVGIAAANNFGDAPEGFKPIDVMPECRSVIVLGAASPPETLNNIAAYTASRNAMLATMTEMSKDVAKQLKKYGCKTKAISASGGKWVEGDGRKEQFGFISLKHAAAFAGLGIIGKNYLLTNPQYGNLLWFSAVLIDADIAPDKKTGFSICDNCNKCVESCPAGALDDIDLFDKKGCSKFFVIEEKQFKIKCFLCRTVCPNRFGIDPGFSTDN